MSLLFDYLSLCFFRNNPLYLTPTRSLMMQTIAFYLVSGIIVESLIADPADGTIEVLLRTIMAFSTISTLLLMVRKWNYFQQLFTAIFICENFIITLALAAEVLDYLMIKQHWVYREEISISLGVCLTVWYIAIVSYIFRQFFAYRTGKSIGFAFGYFILTYGLPMLFMDI